MGYELDWINDFFFLLFIYILSYASCYLAKATIHLDLEKEL